jgi:hypothetical protein
MGYKGEKYVNEMASGKLLIIIDDGIKNAFLTHGKRCVDALKALILGGTRSGRMYMYNGRRYQASAPGEPPANRSGRLANSNDFVARSKELAIFNTAFNGDAPYPFFLEEGTKKMAARAWFEKTMIKLEPLLYQSLLGIKI